MKAKAIAAEKLSEKRWRRPVIETIVENVDRQQRAGRYEMSGNGIRLEGDKTGRRSHPAGGVPVEVLATRLKRTALDRLGQVCLSCLNAKTGSETDRQRTHGNDRQYTAPSETAEL